MKEDDAVYKLRDLNDSVNIKGAYEINIFYMWLEILTYTFQYEGFCFPVRALISNVYIIIKGCE